MATLTALTAMAAPPLHTTLQSVEEGMPIDALIAFSSMSGIDLPSLYEVVIPARTLKHRRSRHETLSLDESDKLARVMRIHAFATRVFGNPLKALRWLSRPKAQLQQRTALSMLRTDIGGRIVEELLGQIDEGMFA